MRAVVARRLRREASAVVASDRAGLEAAGISVAGDVSRRLYRWMKRHYRRGVR